MSEETTFQRKLRERREAEARKSAEVESKERVTAVEASSWASDLIPGEDTEPRPRTSTDKELDRLLGGIGIVEAYHKWCGKMRVDKRRRTAEGIKVSCPKPEHRDSNPSAWLNTDKNVWYCGGCSEGGDVYDIAAMHYGISDYKSGGNFHELRKKMAGAYGYTFVSAPGLDQPIMVPPEKATLEKKVAPIAEARHALGENKRIAAAQGKDADDDAEVVYEFIDAPEPVSAKLEWRKIVKEDTFLDIYMTATTQDDAPDEYHFWNGILGIAMAAGRDIVLEDQKPVLANLFLCLLGPTGDGKSRSHHHLEELLYRALPFDRDDISGKGVEMIESAASAEALISAFINPIYDPTDPKKVASFSPVKGLIKFEELSGLVGRASRKGNVLKPTLMEVYDGKRIIQTISVTNGKKRAENPFGCLFTTTQPKALKNLLREEDASSGFLNRIVFATATPKKRIPIGGIRINVDPAVEPLRAIRSWAGFGRVVQWTPESVETFTKFFHEVLHPAQEEDDTGLLNRMDLLAKKLILLLCINEHSPEVTVDIVEKVIGMFPYLTGAYQVPAAHIGQTINSEVRDELMKHVEKHTASGGITLRRLMQNIKRKNFPLDVVTKTLKHLTDLGFIEAQATTGVGRPTVKYKVAKD